MRFLVVEGNTARGRETYLAGFGKTASERYADALRFVAPESTCELFFVADADARPRATLADYDGVFLTGSALNLYDGGPEVERQVEFARAVYKADVPFFGSCWGLQVACAAAGGEVIKNPGGREIGVARGICLTAAGETHPLLAGRPQVYDALCTHLDVVVLPQGATTLAANAVAPVQAAEIAYDGGVFWGVQYHPEFKLSEVAAIIEWRADALAREGFAQAAEHARDLRGLEESPDAAWRLGLSDAVLTREARTLELRNFIAARVRPLMSARGRA